MDSNILFFMVVCVIMTLLVYPFRLCLSSVSRALAAPNLVQDRNQVKDRLFYLVVICTCFGLCLGGAIFTVPWWCSIHSL